MQLAYHWAAREELPNQAHPVTPANRTTLEPYQLARFQDSAFFDAVVEGRMPLTDLLQVCAHPPTHLCLRDCGNERRCRQCRCCCIIPWKYSVRYYVINLDGHKFILPGRLDSYFTGM